MSAAGRSQDVVFSGYSADDRGLRVWPFDKLHREWRDLTGIRAVTGSIEPRVSILLEFARGSSIQLNASHRRWFRDPVGRLSELLRFAVIAAPAGIPIDSFVTLMAEHGARDVSNRLRKTSPRDVGGQLACARHHFARTDFKQARKWVDEALLQAPADDEANLLKSEVLIRSAATLKKQLEHHRRWHEMSPTSPVARDRWLCVRLAGDDAEAAEIVRHDVLEKDASTSLDAPVQLILYLQRQERWQEAAALSITLAERSTSAEQRTRLIEAAEFQQNLAENPKARSRYRWKQRRRVGLAWFVVVLMAVGLGLRIYAEFAKNRATPPPSAQDESRTTAPESPSASSQPVSSAIEPFAQPDLPIVADLPFDPSQPGRPPRAIHVDLYRSAAMLREEISQRNLVTVLRTQRDDSPAAATEYRRWVDQGALQGVPFMLWELYHMVLAGEEIAPDLLAQTDLKLNANLDQKQPALLYLAGLMHLTGMGRTRDAAAAVALIEQSHAAGFPPATHQLIDHLAFGVGTPRDLKRAIALFDALDSTRLSAEAAEQLHHKLTAVSDPLPPVPDDATLGFAPVWLNPPRIPARLRKSAINAEVKLSFRTDREGFVHDIKMLESDHPIIANAVSIALSFSRFSVRFEDETSPLSQTIELPLTFRLPPKAETP